MMSIEERWAFLVALDDEMICGGVILSEWCSFIVREADTAFANGMHLASILAAVSAIETYLRSECAASKQRHSLAELIDNATINANLKGDLHLLRKYRNRWVHVGEPWSDSKLLEQPGVTERELEDMALFAARALRRTIYQNQWV